MDRKSQWVRCWLNTQPDARGFSRRLKEIPGFKCNEPEGAFYAFPNVSGCLNGTVRTSAEFAQRLLEEEQTVVTDGAGFGCEGYVRMSYATSMEQLREGVKRIKRFAEKLNCTVAQTLVCDDTTGRRLRR